MSARRVIRSLSCARESGFRVCHRLATLREQDFTELGPYRHAQRLEFDLAWAYPCATFMGIQFQWTASDDMAARVAWLLHRPWAIVRGYWYSLLILSMAAVGLIIKPQNWKTDVIFGLAAVVAAAPSLLLMWWRWHRQFQKSPLANADMLADIDDRGVTLSARSGEKTHWWAGFSQIYETRRVVMLEKGDSEYVFLPKRAMSTAQLAEVRHLAASAPNCKVKLAAPMG